MNRHICIHGHFYQPPRENPWLEEVELQDSAYPYHDWNSRITAECYGPNTASRILDPDRRIIDIVSNYSKISFNFGPTLLAWLERHDPEIYGAIIEADKKSQERFSGHGASIAQAYNHMILPLASSRDKRTQIVWGIRDFERRFVRRPEGMWLPEAAVDSETLDILADQGIQFTILAPHQAKRVRKIGDKRWKDVSGSRIDLTMPYICRLPSGRTIALFFHHGPISQEVAFAGLLQDGENFARRLASAFRQDAAEPQLVHIATDGETYGHHHRYGDMALAYCLYYLESNNLAQITVYGEYLENHPPAYEVEIFENSSWSCMHGVERWQSDCGCNSGMNPGWTQDWRAPLRGAMDWLQDNLAEIYEKQMFASQPDVWKMREGYIEVIHDRSVENVERFFAEHGGQELSTEEKVKTLKLLEMQRHAMLMYTSCGWFFDEISALEPVQVLRYAARAIQLAHDVSGISLEEAFVGLLERAPSNIAAFGNGARVYEMLIKPTVLDLLRVGVHYGVSSLFKEYTETAGLYSYIAKSEQYYRSEVGKQKVGIGTVSLRSKITWEEQSISFAVLHLGDHNIIGGAREYMGENTFAAMHKEIEDRFSRSEISEVVRAMDKHFSDHNYSLWHLFLDEQREILRQIIDQRAGEIETSFRQIYEYHYPVMQAIAGLRMPLPHYFSAILELVLNTDIRRSLESEELDFDQLTKRIDEAKRWPVSLDKATFGFIASQRINAFMQQWYASAEEVSLLEKGAELFKVLEGLSLDLNLWEAQNRYFAIGKRFLSDMREKAKKSDAGAKKWIELFERLGNHLRVKME